MLVGLTLDITGNITKFSIMNNRFASILHRVHPITG